MKNVRKQVFLISAALALIATGCSQPSANLEEAPGFVKHTYADFTKAFPDDGFLISDGWSNNVDTSGPFGVTWNASMVDGNESDGLILGVNKTDNLSLIKDAFGEDAPDFDPYLGGEIRTTENYLYGYYGAYMKPSKVCGTVSTFFTYTGPTEDNPHDEIDIEFLGKDTTKVQFNYYAGSDQSHEKWYNLGFDASEDYHHYGFYWDEHEITWFVDFEPVHRIEGATPSHACKVFMNHWKVNSKDFGISAWGGQVDDSALPSYAFVKGMTMGDVDGNAITPLPKGVAYDKYPESSELTAVNSQVELYSIEYSVTEENNVIDISYSGVEENSYANVKLSIEENNGKSLANSKFLSMDIENKASTSTKVRITINSTTYLSIRTAWVDGNKSKVNINAAKTIAIIDVPANSKVNLVVRYYGLNAASIYMMFDSIARDPGDEDPKSGHIVLNNFKVGGEQDAVPEEE